MDFTAEQKELIEKYRDINTDHNWWDHVYQAKVEELVEKGIEADDFAFSGFWSQGDGASFCGRINLATFLKAHDLEQKYPATTFFALQDEVSAKLHRQGTRYSHENTVDVYFYDDIRNTFDEEDLRDVVYETMSKQYLEDEEDLDDDVINICRGYMRELYRELETEYEYLTSDQVVWETIEANELHEVEVA